MDENQQELMLLSKEELIKLLLNEYDIRIQTVDAWKRDTAKYELIVKAAREWAGKAKYRTVEAFKGDPNPMPKEMANSPVDCGLVELWNLVK